MRHSLPTEQPRRRNDGRIASGRAAAPGMVLPRPARVHCAERHRWKLVAKVDCDSPAEGRQVARPRAATTRSEHDRQRKDSPPHRQVSSRTTSTRARCPTEPTASLSWSETRLATRIHRHAHVHRQQWLARWRHRRGAAAFTTRRIRDVDRAALAEQREGGRSSDFSSGTRCQGRRSW